MRAWAAENSWRAWQAEQEPSLPSGLIRPIPVFGDGLQTRSYCYVDDLVDGLVRLQRSDLREPCNLGNPHELTVLALASIVRKLAGSEVAIVHHPLPEDDPRQRRPVIDRARAELGWELKVSFEEGLPRTFAWFRTHRT